jgi:hypothetical protein
MASFEDLSAQFERRINTAKKSLESGLAEFDRKIQSQQLSPPLRDVSRIFGGATARQSSGASTMLGFGKNWSLTTSAASRRAEWNELESTLRQKGEASFRGFSQALGLEGENQASGSGKRPQFSSIVQALSISTKKRSTSMEDLTILDTLRQLAKPVSFAPSSGATPKQTETFRATRSEADIGTLEEATVPAYENVKSTQNVTLGKPLKKTSRSRSKNDHKKALSIIASDEKEASLLTNPTSTNSGLSNSGLSYLPFLPELLGENGPLRHVKTALKDWESEKKDKPSSYPGVKEAPVRTGFSLSVSSDDVIKVTQRDAGGSASSSERASGDFWQDLQQNVKEVRQFVDTTFI